MVATDGRNIQARCGCAACAARNGAARRDNGGTTAQWTVEQAITQLTSGGRWQGGGNGAPLTLTYSFPTSAADYGTQYANSPDREVTGFRPFTAEQRAAALRALSLWQDVANVRFVEAAGGNATIRFGNTTSQPNAVAWAYVPNASDPRAGDVWINPNYPTSPQLGYGQYGYETMTHELGHALGLNHGNNYNGTTNQDNPTHTYDTHQYTVMSYYNHQAQENRGIFPSTPMTLDILAIQRQYGANMTTRTGNSTYGFSVSRDVRSEFDFSVNRRPIVAIWDAGGVDTLNLSGYAQNQVINLRAGGYSSVGGMRDNLGIAVGAVIENAVGGSGNDVITGNDANNQLRGGGGNDRYVVMGRTFGRDVINDTQGRNEVVLNDLRAADVRQVRQGNNLLLRTADGRASVVLANYYTAADQRSYSITYGQRGGEPPSPEPPTPPTPPTPRPDGDAGDTFTTAADLGGFGGNTFRYARGTVGGSDRADIFRIQVQGSQRISVMLGGMTADADLYVYNAGGQLLGQSRNAGAQLDWVSGQLGGGTYYVAVVPYQSAQTGYLLSIGTGAAAGQRHSAIARRSGATATAVARPVSERHSLALRDHVSLNVEARASFDPTGRRERDRHGQIAVGG